MPEHVPTSTDLPDDWPNPANPSHWAGGVAINPTTGVAVAPAELETMGRQVYPSQERTVAPGITEFMASQGLGVAPAADESTDSQPPPPAAAPTGDVGGSTGSPTPTGAVQAGARGSSTAATSATAPTTPAASSGPPVTQPTT